MISPETWHTVDEAATLCRRTPKTIRNLVSRHQLPRRLLWKVRSRIRCRVLFLSPATVAWLQRVTLHGDNPDHVQKPLN